MKTFFLCLTLLGSLNLCAQEESFPCEKANAKLKDLFSTGKLDFLYVHGCNGQGLHGLTSSFLKASGTAPAIITDPDGMEPPEDSDYVDWTCKYAPGNLQDDNTSTAWVEGVAGYGIGEVIVVPCLDLKQPVEIWTGYGKSENLFQYNSRPSKVRAVIIRAKIEGAAQYGTGYKDLTIVNRMEVSLQDKNDYQSLSIPDYQAEKYFSELYNDEVDYQYFLGIEILDVYKGSKWDDTCISEIRNTPLE